MRVNDFVLGLIVLALAVAVMVLSVRLPRFAGETYGAAVFPGIAAIIMAVAGAALAWRGFRHGTRAERGEEALTVDRRALVNLGVTGAAVVAYLFLFQPLGFVVATTALLLVLLVLLRVRLPAAVATAIGVSLLIAVTFEQFLRVPLPWGVLAFLRG